MTEPEYLDVSVPAGASFRHPVKPGHTVFAYVIDGEGYFEDAMEARDRGKPGRSEGAVMLYGPGEVVEVATDKRPVRFLLVAGRPLGEPVAWQGPIVMNTQDELRTAFRELEERTFVKRKG